MTRCAKCYLDPAALNYPCPFYNCPHAASKPGYRPSWRLILLGCASWAVVAGLAYLLSH